MLVNNTLFPTLSRVVFQYIEWLKLFMLQHILHQNEGLFESVFKLCAFYTLTVINSLNQTL